MNITKEMLSKIHQLDLKKFLKEKYNIVFSTENARQATARCPHPDHDDRNPSFCIWKDKNDQWCWCCYSCHCGRHDSSDKRSKNYGNDGIAFVRWMSDYIGSKHIITFQEAAVSILRYMGINICENNASSYSYEERVRYMTIKTNTAVANACSKLLLKYKNRFPYKYLTSRGLEEEDIKTWKIGFNGERIVFPFVDHMNKVIGFTMRKIDNNDQPKYINSGNGLVFNKSKFLYGENKIDKDIRYLIITEGQMDVIMAAKYGIKNVVASSGTAFNSGHIEHIKDKFPFIQKLIFVFDSDAAGMKGLDKALELARASGLMSDYYILPEEQDLCDFVLENKDSSEDIILSHCLPSFYKDIKKDLEEYNNIILSFNNKFLLNVKHLFKQIKNKNEQDIFKIFLKNKFHLKIGDDNHVFLSS